MLIDFLSYFKLIDFIFFDLAIFKLEVTTFFLLNCINQIIAGSVLNFSNILSIKTFFNFIKFAKNFLH